MITFDRLDLSSHFVIISHGGCPDGAVAALIMVRALRRAGAAAEISCIEQTHGDACVTGVDITESTVLMFVDISPTIIDVPMLERAKQVIVFDHHSSVKEDMATVKRLTPQLFDLSATTELECAASLVQDFVCKSYVAPPAILHLAWKLDVFAHVLPAEYEPMLIGFKGWVTSEGEHKTSIRLMEQLVDNMEACLKKGYELFFPIVVHTKRIFDRHRIVYDDALFRLVLVEILPADRCMAVDLPTYQALIDEYLQTGKPTIVATVDRRVVRNDCWSLSLRRAGSGVDVGLLANQLKTDIKRGFVSGGGHPFAAGCQSRRPDLPEADLVASLIEAAKRCIPVAPVKVMVALAASPSRQTCSCGKMSVAGGNMCTAT